VRLDKVCFRTVSLPSYLEPPTTRLSLKGEGTSPRKAAIMAARDAFSRQAMLALYRSVLKLHRRVLPQVLWGGRVWQGGMMHTPSIHAPEPDGVPARRKCGSWATATRAMSSRRTRRPRLDRFDGAVGMPRARCAARECSPPVTRSTPCLARAPAQVKAFAKEWKEYVYTIELQSHQGAFGRDLDPSKVPSSAATCAMS
jgi:hypothetical protein